MCKPVPVAVSHPLEPKLPALMSYLSYLMWVLATESWSSARAACALKHGAIARPFSNI